MRNGLLEVLGQGRRCISIIPHGEETPPLPPSLSLFRSLSISLSLSFTLSLSLFVPLSSTSLCLYLHSLSLPPLFISVRNALVYGAKKWILYPPSHMIMSNKQILDFFETDHFEYERKAIHSVTCVQTAGPLLSLLTP
jgi:hypothetical protein